MSKMLQVAFAIGASVFLPCAAARGDTVTLPPGSVLSVPLPAGATVQTPPVADPIPPVVDPVPPAVVPPAVVPPVVVVPPAVVPPDPAPPAAGPPIAGATHVDLQFADGTALAFDRSSATDLGAYSGAFVHQNNYMTRNGAWSVSFRPDADGSRDEVVVEYGVWPAPAGVTPGHVMQPFTATISSSDGTSIATMNFPHIYWMTRARWQSAPRPVQRTLADLVAMRAQLPINEAHTVNKPPNFTLATAVWTGPMGTAGVLPGMSAPADRQEIGPLTSLQGSYLMRGNSEALAGMMAQAEAAGSFPYYLRDSATNAPVDVYAHPYLGFIKSAKGPVVYPAAPKGPDGKVMPDFFQLNVAHIPSLVIIPWLLTDDPYFLEAAEAQANYAAIETNLATVTLKLPGVVWTAQTRSEAWGLRDVLFMAAFAPENPPGWLLPRSYFRKMSDDNLAYVQKFMAAPNKTYKIFHMFGAQNGGMDPWMHGYLLIELSWARWSGFFPEWTAAIDWAAEPLLQLTADPALGGWDGRWPAPYFVFVNKARVLAGDKTVALPPNTTIGVLDPVLDAATPDSWRELWTLYQQRQVTEGSPGASAIGADDRIYETTAAPYYQENIMGALAAMTQAGVPLARDRYDWLAPRMQRDVYAKTRWNARPFRYAYSPD